MASGASTLSRSQYHTWACSCSLTARKYTLPPMQTSEYCDRRISCELAVCREYYTIRVELWIGSGRLTCRQSVLQRGDSGLNCSRRVVGAPYLLQRERMGRDRMWACQVAASTAAMQRIYNIFYDYHEKFWYFLMKATSWIYCLPLRVSNYSGISTLCCQKQSISSFLLILPSQLLSMSRLTCVISLSLRNYSRVTLFILIYRLLISSILLISLRPLAIYLVCSAGFRQEVSLDTKLTAFRGCRNYLQNQFTVSQEDLLNDSTQFKNYQKLSMLVLLMSILLNRASKSIFLDFTQALISSTRPQALLRPLRCSLFCRASCSSQNIFTSMVPIFWVPLQTVTRYLIILFSNTGIKEIQASPSTSESPWPVMTALSSMTTSCSQFFLRQFFTSVLQLSSMVLQQFHRGLLPLNVFVQQSSRRKGKQTKVLELAGKFLPYQIWITSLRIGAYSLLTIWSSQLTFWIWSWMGSRILMTKLMEPITFWLMQTGAEELTTGARFLRLLQTNGFNQIVDLPTLIRLLPYETHISTVNELLFKYLKKNSSQVTLKLNSDCKFECAPCIGLVVSVGWLQKSTVAKINELSTFLMPKLVASILSNKCISPRNKSKQFVFMPSFTSFWVNIETSSVQGTPFLLMVFCSPAPVLLLVSCSLQAASISSLYILDILYFYFQFYCRAVILVRRVVSSFASISFSKISLSQLCRSDQTLADLSRFPSLMQQVTSMSKSGSAISFFSTGFQRVNCLIYRFSLSSFSFLEAYWISLAYSALCWA